MTEPPPPDQEEDLNAWLTIERWEVTLLAATVVAALVIWSLFVVLHHGRLWPFP